MTRLGQRQRDDHLVGRRRRLIVLVVCRVRHLSKEEFRDGREEREAALKDVRIQESNVGTSFGFAQFLEKKETSKR